MNDRQQSIFPDIPRLTSHDVSRAGATTASLEAADALEKSGQLTECFVRILRFVWRFPDLTFRELAAEITRVEQRECPEHEPARRYRVLCDRNLIEETGRRLCTIGTSGRNCSTYRITQDGVRYMREVDQ